MEKSYLQEHKITFYKNIIKYWTANRENCLAIKQLKHYLIIERRLLGFF